MIGIYGTITYWVAQRTGELGIRRVLGAQTGNILWLVVGRGLGLTAVGLFIGACGAVALTRFMSSLLFHVSPTDPIALVVVSVVTAALSVIALLSARLPRSKRRSHAGAARRVMI